MIFSDTLYDKIFADFLISTKINVSLKKIKDEIYEIKNTSRNDTRSGRNSFQTPSRENTDKKELQKLKNYVVRFINEFLNGDEKLKDLEVDWCYWWININAPNGYNVIHQHGNVEFVGNFYVQTGKDYGLFEVLRNDGSVYNKIGVRDAYFKCDCELGRFYLLPGHLWHYVSNNYSDEDRISISYNIALKSKSSRKSKPYLNKLK